MYQKKPMIGILDQIVEVLDEKTLDLQVPLRDLMLSDLSPVTASTPTPVPARAPAPLQSLTSSLLPGSPSFAFGSLPRYKSADSEKTQVLPDEAVSSPALDAKALERAMTVSRRSEQRVPAVGPMMILNQDGEYISKGEGRNISSKGIGAKIFNCQKRIMVGDLVVLEIYGNKALKPFRAEAKVLNLSVRHRNRRASYWVIGLAWVSMSAFVANMIAEYSVTAGGTMGGFDYKENV
ncbi:MAG: PilZ domain-containing protein [Bdellovibrionales bacterium]|nr:PilZ domain-containing protein [Bdellovibrionales bacterium]